MLHEVGSSYRELAKHFPELSNKAPKGEHARQKLLDMAREGLPRPSQKTKMGRFLSEFTKPSSKSYKPEFHRIMMETRPDWFMSQTEKATLKKRELLDMAKRGLPRPSHDKTRLGQALSNYTRKRSHVYDPDFDREIRELRPDWFHPTK